MTTYEQHTITGELEITDSKTMKVIARKLTLTAERVTSLCGRAYRPGSHIECIFPAHTDLSAGQGAGPWTPGGYGGNWLKRNATEIKRLANIKTTELQTPHNTLILTAGRPCGMNGQRYLAGEKIQCVFRPDDDLSVGYSNGPWQPGGFFSPWLKNHAMKITNLNTDIEISKREREALRPVKIVLTTSQDTTLRRVRYRTGDKIEVTLQKKAILLRGSGPWTPGGYTSQWLKNYAIQVIALPTDNGPKHPDYCICPACKPRRAHKKKAKVDIHFFVEAELKARVVHVAKERGIDLGQIATEALEEWLNSHCVIVTND